MHYLTGRRTAGHDLLPENSVLPGRWRTSWIICPLLAAIPRKESCTQGGEVVEEEEQKRKDNLPVQEKYFFAFFFLLFTSLFTESEKTDSYQYVSPSAAASQAENVVVVAFEYSEAAP